MSNLSKIRRDKMVEFLDGLKKQHKDEESLITLNQIENELQSKRYGLVWEEHEENVDVMLRENIPVFLEDLDKRMINMPGGTMNFILEGDNLHSLNLLRKTHKGKIDIIYIDPPYNTNNSLTYEDTRVGDDDAYRHSMWLSFMSERLEIAKDLLSKQGLIFISIDDNEGYSLKILCDEVFGENNFMGSFSITKAEGGGQAKFIVKGHDLLLVYAQNLENCKPLGRAKDVRGKTFEKDGEIYWIQEDAYRKVFGQYGNLYYEEILDYKDQAYKDDIDKKITNGEIILLDKGENGMHIMGKVRKLSDDYSKYHSVMKQLNANGKSDLAAFGLDELFDYPKPVNLIKELISGAAFLRPGKLTVLDFFAGSGTTGQAVLEFIKETGRDVEFILCTNNEVSAKQKLNFVKSYGYLKTYNPNNTTTDNAIEKKIDDELEKEETSLQDLIEKDEARYESYGICQAVTYPRIKAVIDGFDWQSSNSKVLYKKKLSESNLSKINAFLEEIEEIKKREEYETYKIKIDESSSLVLTAEIKQGEHYDGIPANLLYYRTGFVAKGHEELVDELINHMAEMIQLENGVVLDDKHYIMVLSDEEADELQKNWKKYPEIKTLYISSDVLLTAEQEKLFQTVEIRLIPDHYFGLELREVGELW